MIKVSLIQRISGAAIMLAALYACFVILAYEVESVARLVRWAL